MNLKGYVEKYVEMPRDLFLIVSMNVMMEIPLMEMVVILSVKWKKDGNAMEVI